MEREMCKNGSNPVGAVARCSVLSLTVGLFCQEAFEQGRGRERQTLSRGRKGAVSRRMTEEGCVYFHLCKGSHLKHEWHPLLLPSRSQFLAGCPQPQAVPWICCHLPGCSYFEARASPAGQKLSLKCWNESSEVQFSVQKESPCQQAGQSGWLRFCLCLHQSPVPLAQWHSHTHQMSPLWQHFPFCCADLWLLLILLFSWLFHEHAFLRGVILTLIPAGLHRRQELRGLWQGLWLWQGLHQLWQGLRLQQGLHLWRWLRPGQWLHALQGLGLGAGQCPQSAARVQPAERGLLHHPRQHGRAARQHLQEHPGECHGSGLGSCAHGAHAFWEPPFTELAHQTWLQWENDTWCHAEWSLVGMRCFETALGKFLVWKREFMFYQKVPGEALWAHWGFDIRWYIFPEAAFPRSWFLERGSWHAH